MVGARKQWRVKSLRRVNKVLHIREWKGGATYVYLCGSSALDEGRERISVGHEARASIQVRKAGRSRGRRRPQETGRGPPLFLPFARMSVPKETVPASESGMLPGIPNQRCVHCNTESTPLWRNGPLVRPLRTCACFRCRAASLT
jgi:hypothetical protein